MAYTYYDLLEETAKRKQKAVAELNKALRGKGGWLVKAEIERNPGSVAWLWLAKGFCEALADHIDEFLEQVGMDTPYGREIGDIYMAYYDDRYDDLYDMLPVEAQLFTR